MKKGDTVRITKVAGNNFVEKKYEGEYGIVEKVNDNGTCNVVVKYGKPLASVEAELIPYPLYTDSIRRGLEKLTRSPRKPAGKYADVSFENVVKNIRASRELMNNNGSHWIRGSEKAMVSLDEPNTTAQWWQPILTEPDGSPVVAYCLMGGQMEVSTTQAEQDIATIELAYEISPEGMAENEREAGYELLEGGYYDFSTDTVQVRMLDYMIESAVDIITSWNDDKDRTWPEVRDLLTRTAAKVRKRGKLRVFRGPSQKEIEQAKKYRDEMSWQA